MIDRHYHWAFLAYNDEDVLPDAINGQRINFMVKVSVVGYICEADARLAARDVLERDQFRLCDVWECSQSMEDMVKSVK
jgi:hypothetical protein